MDSRGFRGFGVLEVSGFQGFREEDFRGLGFWGLKVLRRNWGTGC